MRSAIGIGSAPCGRSSWQPCSLAAAALPAPALAAPPANDQRAAAQALTLPAGVSGTTRETTLEEDEPGSCAQLRGSVWYSIQPAAGRRVVARLAASGDLDAVVDVFQRTRSQLSAVECDVGNSRGQAEVEFRTPSRPTSYLIRVGQRVNSVPGSFRLDVFTPQPPPRPPGAQLPASGVTRTVNSTTNASDAFSIVMRAGTTYRIHRAQASGCTTLELFAPGTSDFESDSPVRRGGCGGYFLFTPAAGEGGRYSLVVTAQPRRRGDQRYHLQVAQAGEDDTSPGLALANYQRARGALQGNGVDVVDLYRFSLARRSLLRVRLRGSGFRVQLLRDTGRATRRERGRRDPAPRLQGALLHRGALQSGPPRTVRPASARRAPSPAHRSPSTERAPRRSGPGRTSASACGSARRRRGRCA